MEKDPDGGSWPAYPSGKSWDEPSGKTGSGKKFYHNILPGSSVKAEPFYVAISTPVIHYCMGGLEIDCDSTVHDDEACTTRTWHCMRQWLLWLWVCSNFACDVPTILRSGRLISPARTQRRCGHRRT